jgi:glycyl-tRNA synthetase (class II)
VSLNSWRAVPLQELAHYALATTDLEFQFSFGWDELWGIANRGDFDLRAHAGASGQDLRYRDPVTNEASSCVGHDRPRWAAE